MAEKDYLNTFQDNDKRAKRAIIWQFIPTIYGIVFGIIAVLLLIFGGLSIYSLSSSDNSTASAGAIVLIAALVFLAAMLGLLGVLIASVVFYLMWVHRAHQNAEFISGEKLFLSAGWNVGFHFIPLANLIVPYLLMLQIAEKSSSKQAKNITLTWWILVLVSSGISILLNIFSFSSSFITSFSSAYNNEPDYGFSPLGTSLGVVELLGGGVGNLVSLAVFVISFFVIHLVNKGQKAKAKEMGLLSEQKD
jgi:hypothetical protein